MSGILREYLDRGKYKYYDSPEGEDCLKKFWYVTKYSTIYGVLISSIDVTMYSHPQGYWKTLGRMSYITAPIVGMGMAFTCTTCLATNIRQKDDVWNYFLGGISMSAVLGAWNRSVLVGGYSAPFLAVFFAVVKDHVDNGWPILGSDYPTSFQKTGDLSTWDRDYTISKDPAKTS